MDKDKTNVIPFAKPTGRAKTVVPKTPFEEMQARMKGPSNLDKVKGLFRKAPEEEKAARTPEQKGQAAILVADIVKHLGDHATNFKVLEAELNDVRKSLQRHEDLHALTFLLLKEKFPLDFTKENLDRLKKELYD